MPNTKKTKTALPGKAGFASSHETAFLNTSLNYSLKGTKHEILKELSSIMHVQVAFIFQAITDGIAYDNDHVQTAMTLYYESFTKHHYVLNNIES